MNLHRHFVKLSALLAAFVASCAEDGPSDTSYEPLFLNETNAALSLSWSIHDDGETAENTDRNGKVVILPNDTAYCEHGGHFPYLHESGLDWAGRTERYDVEIVFDGEPQKCLWYKGEALTDGDIRAFDSYEDLGQCGFCMSRAQTIPHAMLYRITEEMRASAGPCE